MSEFLSKTVAETLYVVSPLHKFALGERELAETCFNMQRVLEYAHNYGLNTCPVLIVDLANRSQIQKLKTAYQLLRISDNTFHNLHGLPDFMLGLLNTKEPQFFFVYPNNKDPSVVLFIDSSVPGIPMEYSESLLISAFAGLNKGHKTYTLLEEMYKDYHSMSYLQRYGYQSGSQYLTFRRFVGYEINADSSFDISLFLPQFPAGLLGIEAGWLGYPIFDKDFNVRFLLNPKGFGFGLLLYYLERDCPGIVDFICRAHSSFVFSSEMEGRWLQISNFLNQDSLFEFRLLLHRDATIDFSDPIVNTTIAVLIMKLSAVPSKLPF